MARPPFRDATSDALFVGLPTRAAARTAFRAFLSGVERHRLTRASLYRDVDRAEAIRAIISLVALCVLILFGCYLWRR